MRGRVVLCGLGRVGVRVLENLLAAGWDVTVIDLFAQPTESRFQKPGVRLITGDCRKEEILRQAEIESAFGVLIVTSNDLINVGTALTLRRLHPTVRLIVRMFNQNLISRLGTAVNNTIALSVSALTAPYIALTALSGESLGVFKIDQTPQQIALLEVAPMSPYLGERIGDLAERMKVLVLALRTPQQPIQFLKEVPGKHPLQPGDRLIVAGAPQAVAELLNQESQTGAVRWATSLKRITRLIRRLVNLVDGPMALATLTLILTLLASTVVFRYGVDVSWSDGFYETVSVITTGSDLHGEGKPSWFKTFLGVLKILGLGLVAAYTALFTNYLVRARLSGIFETRRIPEQGHVVVCGLGNIGFRCIEELKRLGIEVVAIEKVNDSPFAATVRRMGVPVVIGDATVLEVLRQARVTTARAVITATSDELADLEIGLLVRELNPQQRVVVRLSDPEFAQAARDAANLRLAVSPPALAASAFVAALYGDRIQTLANVHGQQLAVLDLVITEEDQPLIGRTIRELMVDYHFQPLGLSGHPPFAQTGVSEDLAAHRLQLNETLTLALKMSSLDRLLRRERPAADQQVVMTSFPISAREELIVLLMSANQISREEAAARLEQLPALYVQNVTPGQAEEQAARLRRERVNVIIEPVQSH